MDKIHVLAGVLREFRAMREDQRIWVKKPRYNEVRVITRRRVITRSDVLYRLNQCRLKPIPVEHAIYCIRPLN